jgi:hypothetical protein
MGLKKGEKHMSISKNSVFAAIAQVLVILGIMVDGFVWTCFHLALTPILTDSNVLGWFGAYKASSGSITALSGANHRAYTDKVLFAAWRGICLILVIPSMMLDSSMNGGTISEGGVISFLLAAAAGYFLLFKPLIRKTIDANEEKTSQACEKQIQREADDVEYGIPVEVIVAAADEEETQAEDAHRKVL